MKEIIMMMSPQAAWFLCAVFGFMGAWNVFYGTVMCAEDHGSLKDIRRAALVGMAGLALMAAAAFIYLEVIYE